MNEQRTAPELDGGPVVYTVPEVARLLAVARSTAYELVRDGAIPAQRLGRRWVIPRRRFHAWLEGTTSGPGEAA